MILKQQNLIAKIWIPFPGIHTASIIRAWFFIQKFYLIILAKRAVLPLQPLWTALPKYVCRNNESSTRSFPVKTRVTKINHRRNHCSLNMPKQSSNRIHTWWSRNSYPLPILNHLFLAQGQQRSSLERMLRIVTSTHCNSAVRSPFTTACAGFSAFGTLWTAHVIFLDYLSHRKLPFISPFPQLFHPSIAVYHHLRHFAAQIDLSNLFWTLITEIIFKANYKTVKVFFFSVCLFLQEYLNTFNIIFFKAQWEQLAAP